MADAAVIAGGFPFGGDQLLHFEALEGGVERAGFGQEDVVRHLADELSDGVPVFRAEDECAEDEHFESALQELHPVGFRIGHGQ